MQKRLLSPCWRDAVHWLRAQNEEEGLAPGRGIWKRDQSTLICSPCLILYFHRIQEWTFPTLPWTIQQTAAHKCRNYSSTQRSERWWRHGTMSMFGHDSDDLRGLISRSFTYLSDGFSPFLCTSFSFPMCKRKGAVLGSLKEHLAISGLEALCCISVFNTMTIFALVEKQHRVN